ncbi:hypothetical protein HMPREF0308_0800 [Corynebacterium striatum ATCC 6940]|nr:hypothetical protein HMPREF0308_0800 [Corynebacterium striatum ATCC 6940]
MARRLWRLIPAYAGRTRAWKSGPCVVRAHPRLRGADDAPAVERRAHAGSSPLTRGGLAVLMGPVGLIGLIPAYAGRTLVLLMGGSSARAHPRLRGADSTLGFTRWNAMGSSPLTRGGRPNHQRGDRIPRLIPAYAGRT